MQIRIKGDSVEISGYVNAVERKSKPLWSRMGQFIERICKGAFKRALERNHDVRILLNHDPEYDLGGQKDGNLELEEDAIGLRAKATITDKEVVQKARDGKLVGWSFGFYDREVELKRDEDGFPLRDVRDLDLEEVSILDDTTTPAYDGTLVAVRSEGERNFFFSEAFKDEIQTRDESPKADEHKEDASEQDKPVPHADKKLDEYQKLVADMKN